jgi:hypothetical protein
VDKKPVLVLRTRSGEAFPYTKPPASHESASE